MSIFTKTTSLEERRKSRNSLITKIEVAASALDEARNNAVDLAADGVEDSKQAIANDLIKTCDLHLTVLQNALAKTEAEISRLEFEDRQKIEKIERENTAKKLNKTAEVYEKSIINFPSAIQEILKAYENAKAVTGETGLPIILTNFGKEVSDAVATFVADLRLRSASTLSGSAPPSLPIPFVPEIIKQIPELPTTQIFSLEHLSWKDEKGAYQSCAAFQIRSLPVAAAETAVKRNLAILPDSERAIAMKNEKNRPHLLNSGRIFDLSADPNEPRILGHNGELKTFFEPYHRGEPFKVTVPRDPDLEVAQR